MSKRYDHWYPRYPADYKKDTAHLNLTEHGAYTVLMDHYYLHGPIQAYEDVNEPSFAIAKHMYRICGALDAQERSAVDKVLSDFFTIKDGFYHNKRADEELTKREEISEKRRIAQEKSVNARKCKKEKEGFANASAKANTSTATDSSSARLLW